MTLCEVTRSDTIERYADSLASHANVIVSSLLALPAEDPKARSLAVSAYQHYGEANERYLAGDAL